MEFEKKVADFITHAYTRENLVPREQWEQFLPQMRMCIDASLAGAHAMVGTNPQSYLDIKDNSAYELVTAGDIAADKAMIALTKERFSRAAIVTEETNPYKENPQALLELEDLYVFDPNDGSVNLGREIKGLTVCCASHVSRGEVTAVSIANPVTIELWYAQKGMGAYHNGYKINVATTKTLDTAFVAFDTHSREENRKLTRRIFETLNPAWDAKWGSSILAIARVAQGVIDLYFQTVKPWDRVAGLLVEEAGGVIRNWDGSKGTFIDNHVVVGNEVLVEQFVKRIKTLSS